jgi:hypothetical protein
VAQRTRLRTEHARTVARGRRPDLRDPHYLSSISSNVIRINAASTDQEQRILTLNINDAFLPQTPVTAVCALGSVPGFAQPIREAINLGLRYTSPASISRDFKVIGMFSTLVHFAEWCWSQGFRNFAELDAAAMKEFQQELERGYWPGALNWVARLNSYLATLEDTTRLKTFVSVRATRFGEKIAINYPALSEVLGTYLGNGSLPDFAYREIERSLQVPLSHRGRDWGRQITSSAYSRAFENINLLYEIHNEELGLRNRPFLSPRRIAAHIASVPKRTRTITVDTLEKMLAESFRWLFDIAPVVVEAMQSTPPLRPSNAGPRKRNQMRQKQIARYVPARFNALISERGIEFLSVAGTLSPRRDWDAESQVTLVEVIRSIHAAARLVICATTAKRSAAISDRNAGLRVNSMQTIDEQFGIYVCEFRSVKKRVASRRNEEISRLTAEAIKSCELLNATFHNMYPGALGIDFDRSAPLMSIPVPGPTGCLKSINSREEDKERSRLFHTALARYGVSLETATAHVLRRMYALIYYYRFEMPILVALSQRLGHPDLEVTKVYVTTDGGGAVNIEPLGAAELMEVKVLEEELEKVGIEYFSNKVLGILRGERLVGGFPKIVRRYLKWFYNAEHIEVTADEATAIKVVGELKRRGFSPTPNKHGTCFATERSIVKVAARCRDSRDGKLHKERASTGLCRNCPHHLATSSFLPSLRQRKSELQEQLASGKFSGIMLDAMASELVDLLRTIEQLEI